MRSLSFRKSTPKPSTKLIRRLSKSLNFSWPGQPKTRTQRRNNRLNRLRRKSSRKLM